MGNLGGHDDGFAGGKAAGDGPAEAAVPVIGKATDAEGLNDKSVVGGGQGFQDASAGAWNQLQEKDPVVQLLAEAKRSLALSLVINIENDRSGFIKSIRC